MNAIINAYEINVCIVAKARLIKEPIIQTRLLTCDSDMIQLSPFFIVEDSFLIITGGKKYQDAKMAFQKLCSLTSLNEKN